MTRRAETAAEVIGVVFMWAFVALITVGIPVGIVVLILDRP